ncbi:protein SON isoform X2 [Homalodisca vitripennis]|uniref:protein SON isoform X2 n=1 Tax=Homalodisca vitripennis TaxID=197043 RepID=UPI001EECC4AF|nr:protein SON isoform X2 [Homalodisca vitripennis]
MSAHLAQLAPSEGETPGGGHGSVRPSELTLVVGGGLAPPSPSHTPRNKSPVTVQEWVDSLPLTPTEVTRGEEEGEPRIVLSQDPSCDDTLTLGAEAGSMCGPLPPSVQVTSCREPSESGSHCSSVESLLEARKPDPEEVLLSLGFGGNNSTECRIPQRFLRPSQLRGVAIDDFLRHQQEMVTNFETGFCGYRGLSGPSHTMPSVIVAKIMEKLREHEKESCSVASPPRVSTNTDQNKFSRVARNVLTKIRCVPGNSVLTPDNRKWLDSQGHKSPEIGRKRIIIGQQSFTFGQDGDLIENHSPPSSLTDSDRWTSSTGTPGLHKTEFSSDKPVFPSIQEDLMEPSLPIPPHHPYTHPPRHAFANVVTTLLAEKQQQESKLSSSSMDVSDEDKQWSRSLGDSGLPSSGRSSRGLDESEMSDQQARVSEERTLGDEPVSESVLQVPPSSDSLLAPIEHSSRKESRRKSENNSELSFLPVSEDSNATCSLSVSSDSTEASKKWSEKYNSSEVGHEIDEQILENSIEDFKISDSLTLSGAITSLPSSEMSTPLLASPWPSLASELERVDKTSTAIVTEGACSDMPNEMSHDLITQSSEIPTKSMDETIQESHAAVSAPVKVIESLDKVIESLEKIMEPLEVISESDQQISSVVRAQANRVKLLRRYEDLSLLAEQLQEVGVAVEIGSADQFLLLTVNERCALQCRVIRLALSTYQAQLAVDSSHYELKCCLGEEAHRLSDLLHTVANPEKLATLVQQMCELLKHQAELREELHDWGSEPLACHQLCEVVLRRLRALELVVSRNTRALSDLRSHV